MGNSEQCPPFQLELRRPLENKEAVPINIMLGVYMETKQGGP